MHDWHYFFNCSDDLESSTYRIFESHQQAQILHWFGSSDVAKSQKEAFIQALIDFDDRCGDFYRYRAYFLASEALAHFKDCSQADAIVRQLLKWSYVYFNLEKQDWKNHPEPLAEAARTALKFTDRKRVIAHFVRLLHTTESRFVLRHAAERLGKLDPGNKTAIAALVLLIQVTRQNTQILKAVDSLTKIDPDNPIVIPTLIKLTQVALKHGGWEIVRNAVWKLGEVATGSEVAIDALIELMHTARRQFLDEQARQVEMGKNDVSCADLSHYAFICEQASRTLQIISTGNKAAISATIELIQQSQFYPDTSYPIEGYINWQAVEALGEIAVGDKMAIADLSQILQTNQSVAVRCAVAASLVKIDPGNADAIAILSQILETTWSELTQLRATGMLDNEGRVSVSQLESLLWRAADSLARIDPTHQLAIDALFQLVQTQTSIRYYLPLSAAYTTLEAIDPSHQLAIAALVHLITTSKENSVWEAVRHLGEVAKGSKLAITALVQLIQTSQDESDLRIAAYSLGQIDPGNPLAIATLVNLLDNSENSFYCWRAAEKLGQIGMADAVAISALIQFVQTFKPIVNQFDFLCIADSFKNVSSSDLLVQVVSALKSCLGNKHRHCPPTEYELFQTSGNWDDIEGDRSEACYHIIWHCAQKMTYPDFYKAWHNSLS